MMKRCKSWMKLYARMEKLCATMMKRKPPMECLKNVWNENGIGLKIK
jgi:hypothetical protein